MKSDYDQRVLNEANYFVNHSSTVRDTAKHFKISKSTIHKDLCSDALRRQDNELYNKVRRLLDNNFSIKHLRGGLATKYKYMKIKEGDNFESE